MSRTTIDFGIDLGTTNSAIAVLKGVTPEIIKNNADADITPSAISIDKKGAIHVGQRAKNRLIDAPEDAYVEFKRRMGTDYTYHFKSSGQSRKPEELSTEILRSVRADVQQRTGEMIEAAVITVPAVFGLHQCDATRKAAQLAGFKASPMVQEPVAAALAYGFQGGQGKAYWLVYDFGGGTFDAAIIKAEEGTIHVVNFGGDVSLGGSDIDWAIVEKLIVPRILQSHDLKNFNRANAGVGKRWYRAFMRLKFAAEQAKIDLSQKEVANLNDSDYARNLTDDLTKQVVIEDLDLEISRQELIALAEPFILKSTEITKRVLKEKKLSPSDIERVILVGGPTRAPYFREILTNNLGIPLDHSVDPLTVVARGAAVFAGTQRSNAHAATPVAAGEYSIDLEHKPVGMDSAPMVGGKVSGPSTQDFTHFTLVLVNTKTQWRSGKVSLRPDGVFIATLHVERGDRNSFAIELFDASGRKQRTTPDTLTYTIGAVVDEQPLIKSMGVALANNEYKKFFKKGAGLPLKVRHDFKTIQPLRQGQSGALLRVPVVEGEKEKADHNWKRGEVVITAEHIHRDLPVGSDVEVTLEIDASRIITITAYVPLLEEEFVEKIKFDAHPPDAYQLQKHYDAEMERFRELKSKAAATGGEAAERLVEELETLAREIKEPLAAAKGDPDAATKCQEEMLQITIMLDKAVDALDWPALMAEARDWLDYLKAVVEQHGTELQRERATKLHDEIETSFDERRADGLRQRIEHVARLYYEILNAQSSYWVHQFQQMEKKRSAMPDQARVARLLNQGQVYMSENNSDGLQNVVRHLWSLLPKAAVETAMRGYQSGLVE